MPQTAIWWIRRDLRLHDNPALTAALNSAEQVIPLFIVDPHFDQSPYVAEKRRAFLWASLRELDADLRERGSRLIVRHGRALATLASFVDETKAHAIFAVEDFSTYAITRDEAVSAELPLELVDTIAVRPPGSVLKQDGDPYVVYTPFKKTWRGQTLPRESDLLPAPDAIATPDDLATESLPDSAEMLADVPFPAGEAEARRRLDAFSAEGIFSYDKQRDFMALDGTSKLSPYLRFGMLSAREAVVVALKAMAEADTRAARENAETWLSELIWRDFYLHILAHFPRVMGAPFYEKYAHIEWRNDEAEFAAWCEGRTGYPVVDAAMRQLKTWGWMHNRARMIVASFLVKDLLIDWRWGERWFMQQLVDGDPASNNGGWQWSAGTGTDAAPYFRIFNPISQGQKFDPDGDYVRRWVPELAAIEGKQIHTPWKLPPMEQRRLGIEIGEDYPAPIVDHKQARERTLAAYKAASAQAEAA